MQLLLNPKNPADYHTFLRVKRLPVYRFIGRTAWFPDEYAQQVTGNAVAESVTDYEPSSWLFDYQGDICKRACHKRKFACFVDCGLGKTPMLLEFARHAAANLPAGKCVLIVSPLMVVRQTVAEAKRFYGDSLPIEVVAAKDLASWLTSGTGKIGITNYDALDDEIPQGRLGGMVLDESSMLKSHYGKWGTTCIRLGKGLDWKMALTGTPAPNDRIEYANHAVFLDHFPTVNAFLARYFVNRGETQNRWELKPHALRPFYKSLSHWSIFLTNPATYGWKDNCETIPPIHCHIHDVPLTDEQKEKAQEMGGGLFGAIEAGGIGSRAKMAQLAKGKHNGEQVETRKPRFIRQLVESWPDESTIIWCRYNDEQERVAAEFPDAANIDGSTPQEERETLIADFKSGRRKVLISKPRLLGFGLNLQVATRQVFSALHDSYEEYYQAVKRSNRYGSTKPLNVHIPVTDLERPMVDTVLRKAKRVQDDTEEQEKLFKEMANG